MRIDLHTHSNRSDGTDSPAELVQKSAALNLDVVALTDHDNTAGWDEAQTAADACGIRLVRGMEVSTKLHGTSVHLLGYGFDPDHTALNAELKLVLDSREQRVPRILELLAAQGMSITMAQVEEQSGRAAAIGKPHIADALIKAGHIGHRDEAFQGLLDDGGSANVEKYGIPLARAIELLKDAGGRAVIAHPWARESQEVLSAEAIASLVESGLDGIEVDHNDHELSHRAELREIAADLGLVVTGSSDYHGTGKSSEFFLGCHVTAPEEFERLFG
ncbi:PHP domain-containing protein [Aeromicrobium sp. CF3.5]|uniref:PHP domain-containing protein n=1 Tax=Aeromicrobium sp. CF3.5 TaxID=3373078 RepID=UPI003EE703A4